MAIKTKTKTVKTGLRNLQIFSFKKVTVSVNRVAGATSGVSYSYLLRASTFGFWGSWKTTTGISLSFAQTIPWGGVGINITSGDDAYAKIEYTVRTGSDA